MRDAGSIEAQLRSIAEQKQAVDSQRRDLERAISEVEKSPRAFRIVANVMVEADRDDLTRDLSGSLDIAELRLKTLEKKEDQLKADLKRIQERLTQE